MTIDVLKLSGKPFTVVIDELCLSVTDRWRGFWRDVHISDAQVVSQADPNVMYRGINCLDDGETLAEQQANGDKAAFAAALSPFFQALREGNLIAQVEKSESSSPARSTVWSAPWRLIHLHGCSTLIRLDHNGNETDALHLGIVEIPSTTDRHMAEFAELAMLPARKKTQNRNQSTQACGGRPEKYDWAAFTTALGKKLYDEGVPKKGDGGQAAIVEWAKDWFGEKFGTNKQPEESSIKKRVSKILKTYAPSTEAGEKPKLFSLLADKQR